MKYRVVFEQDEDGVFIASCPSLPGCISQGRTRAEAQANISERQSGDTYAVCRSMVNQSRQASRKKLLRLRWDEITGHLWCGSGKSIPAIGYNFDEQEGSHIIIRHQLPPHRRLSIPNHKQLAKGTLRALMRQAGLTVEEFSKLL